MNKAFSRVVAETALLLTLACPIALFAQSSQGRTYEVIIKNGRIIDGSGNPWVSGDLAITGDRIASGIWMLPVPSM
jgi:N-acyl-D-amino-acid deacylase